MEDIVYSPVAMRALIERAYPVPRGRFTVLCVHRDETPERSAYACTTVYLSLRVLFFCPDHISSFLIFVHTDTGVRAALFFVCARSYFVNFIISILGYIQISRYCYSYL